MELKPGLLRVLLLLMILGLISCIHSLGAAPLSRSLKLAGDDYHEGPLTQEFKNQVQVMSLIEGAESNYYHADAAGRELLMVEEVEASYDDYHTGANNHHDPKPPEH